MGLITQRILTQPSTIKMRFKDDMMRCSVLMVGCGNMGFAMLKTWTEQKSSHYDFTVIEPNLAQHAAISSLGVTVVAAAEALKNSNPFDLVFLAVKPQIMARALDGMKGNAKGKTYISVAAGLPIAFFETYLGTESAIIRTMPNTPAAVGAGAIAMIGNSNVPALALEQTEYLLALNGLVRHVENEDQLDAITALSGSGPAYIFHMAECLEQAGIEMGLSEAIARDFARQTIFGAGKLLHESTEDAADLRKSVTSPNGTTQAGLERLMQDGALEKLILSTTKAAENRSKELAKQTLS